MFFCDWFSQMELSVLSRNREVLGRRETLHNCHSPVHTAGCKAGRSPQKCPHLKTEVFIWSTSGKRGAVMDYSWDWHGGDPPIIAGGSSCALGLRGRPEDEEKLTVHEPSSGIYVCVNAGWGTGVVPHPSKKRKTTEKNRDEKETSKQMRFYRNWGTIYPQHSKRKLGKHLEKSENKLKLVGRLWQSWQLKLPLACWQQRGINLCVTTYPWKTPSLI